MSILDLPTEVLEVVLRDMDPLGLVSLYQSHPDIADRIDSTTGIWERTCRRYTPAAPLKALLDQHLDKKFCFTPDKWPLICLKLAKPFLYVSQLLKPEERQWVIRDEDEESDDHFRIDSIFTYDGSTFLDASGNDGVSVKIELDQTHSFCGKFYSTFDDMDPIPHEDPAHVRIVRYEKCIELRKIESKLPVWYTKVGPKASCIFLYGNLLIVGTRKGQLRLYTVKPEIADPKDILTKVPGTPHPFATIYSGNSAPLGVPKDPSYSSILNLKTELLYVARTSCAPIRCIDVNDQHKVFSVVCTDRRESVYRIDIPSEWDSESEFLSRIL